MAFDHGSKQRIVSDSKDGTSSNIGRTARVVTNIILRQRQPRNACNLPYRRQIDKQSHMLCSNSDQTYRTHTLSAVADESRYSLQSATVEFASIRAFRRAFRWRHYYIDNVDVPCSIMAWVVISSYRKIDIHKVGGNISLIHYIDEIIRSVVGGCSIMILIWSLLIKEPNPRVGWQYDSNSIYEQHHPIIGFRTSLAAVSSGTSSLAIKGPLYTW